MHGINWDNIQFATAVAKAHDSVQSSEGIQKKLNAIRREIGGYVTISRDEGLPIWIAVLGFPFYDRVRMPDFLAFSQEKATRLSNLPDHNLSSQSRDPENSQFGGAVRGNHQSGRQLIVAVSGCPEELDELLAALILLELNELTIDEAQRLLHQSQNSYVKLSYLRLGNKYSS